MITLHLTFEGCQIVFQSSSNDLFFYQQCRRILISLRLCKHLFSLFSILSAVFEMVYHLHFLIAYVKQLFMYLLVICMPSFEKCEFKSFAHFFFPLPIFYWIICLFTMELEDFLMYGYKSLVI